MFDLSNIKVGDKFECVAYNRLYRKGKIVTVKEILKDRIIFEEDDNHFGWTNIYNNFKKIDSKSISTLFKIKKQRFISLNESV
jgi:hypothetical protein